MKLTRNSKIILGFIGIAAVLFILLNAAWVMHYHSFDRFERSDYTRPFGSSYVTSKDDYDYNIKYPDYLQFSGNLAITNDPDTLSLIIWPQPFKSGEYEVGAIIYDEERGRSYYIYLNSELNADLERYNLSDEEELIFSDVVSKRKDEINGMYSLAEREWNL